MLMLTHLHSVVVSIKPFHCCAWPFPFSRCFFRSVDSRRRTWPPGRSNLHWAYLSKRTLVFCCWVWRNFIAAWLSSAGMQTSGYICVLLGLHHSLHQLASTPTGAPKGCWSCDSRLSQKVGNQQSRGVCQASRAADNIGPSTWECHHPTYIDTFLAIVLITCDMRLAWYMLLLVWWHHRKRKKP